MAQDFSNTENLFKIEDNVLKSNIDVSSLYGKSFGEEMIKALETSSEAVIMTDGQNDQHLTGRQVLNEVLKLASSLIGQGLNKGDVIGFYIDCKHLVLNAIGFMASIAAGLTYTGCDYRYPYEELLQLCKKTNVKVLVTSESTLDVVLRVRDKLPQIKSVFILDKPNSSIGQPAIVPYLFNLPPSDVHLPVPVDPEKDIVLLGFSSGSTGVPKAVCYNHRNLLSFAVFGWKPFNVTSRPADIVLLTFPMYHIADIGMFISTLLHRNRMILYPYSEPWLVCAEKYRATTALAVPNEINYFAKNPNLYSIESVTDIVLTGSKTNPSTCQQFMSSYKIKQIRNLYGSTETGWISIIPTDLSGKVNITCSGTVLPGVQVKVVNKNNRKLCGPNEVGVICAKTPMTCLGYLNNDEANREAFDNDGFFETGDAGYFDATGFIFVTDRYKEIFNCDGFSVSPTEIEEVLMSHEAVQEVAVFGKVHDIHGEVAKAFVVLKQNQKTTESELTHFANEKLVFYKHLIGGVEFMPSFPRTLRGKIDRKLLKSTL